MKWLMEAAVEAEAGLSLAKMTIEPNCVSEVHLHDNCSETVHVLSGHIEQRVGEKLIEMKESDTCLIPKNTKHQTRNLGTAKAVLIVAYSSGKRNYITD